MASSRDDLQVRQMAFEFLSQLTIEYGDTLPYALLSQGINFKGTRVPLLGPQGSGWPDAPPRVTDDAWGEVTCSTKTAGST